VTGRYGTIGAVYYIPGDFWPLNTTLYVRDFKGNDPRFVAYLLRTLDFSIYSDKAAVPGVNRNHLHEMRVRVPPPGQQRQIADVLGALDDRIDLTRKSIKTLEQTAERIFQSWFVDFDPVRRNQASPGQEGGPEGFPSSFQDSVIGDIPRGWAVRPIGSVVDAVGGSTPRTGVSTYWEGGSINWATPRDLARRDLPVLFETERKITDAGLAQIASGLLPSGTVLLSSRAPIGYTAVAQTPVAVNQGFIALRPAEDLSSAFLYFWIKSAMLAILGRANGSTFPEISKGSFRGIPVIVPPRPAVRAFDTVVGPIFHRIAVDAQRIDSLARIRDLLTTRLVSGELAVPDLLKCEPHFGPSSKSSSSSRLRTELP
jgi:type I restriction enzyme S subunit